MNSIPTTYLVSESVNNLFDYHAPDEFQIQKMNDIRGHAKQLAMSIQTMVPECADKSAAIRLLRQCVQIANAGIVLNESKS